MNIKKLSLILLALTLLVVSACTSSTDVNGDDQNYEGPESDGENPTYSPPTLESCLTRCEEPDYKTDNEPEIKDELYPSNYHNCQVSCYGQRAQFTKEPADCNPILEFARQNPNSYYPKYFYCLMEDVGRIDPVLCDVARDDANLRTNYPYCINKIAIKTKDASVCERLSGIDQDNFYLENCVGAITRGY